MFRSEAELVEYSLPFVIEKFKEGNNEVAYCQEPKGLFGIPDLILFNGKIVSIEYKLKNWKQAIKQAFRYKSFSYESYVILDKDFVNVALKNIDMFEKYNIGLGAVNHENIEFYYSPNDNKPFNENLTCKAMELFINNTN